MVASHPISSPPRRLPRDYGLTGLGLVMQVSGGMAIAANALLILQSFAMPTGSLILIMLAVVISGIVRSTMHYAAGTKLASSSPDGWQATRRYARFALFQSMAVVALIVVPLDSIPSLGLLLWVLLALAAWPVTVLLVLSRRGMKEAFEASRVGGENIWPRDRGLMGAGVLMTTLGLLGCLISAMLVITIIPQTSKLLEFGGLNGILILVLVAVLTVRSVVHFTTGLVGLRADHVNFITGINRYFTWAVVSVAVVVALSFVSLGAAAVARLPLVAMSVAVLLIWPASLVALAKKLPWDMDDVGAPNGRAADGGLTALGFLLLGLGVFSLTVGLFKVMVLGGGSDLGLPSAMIRQMLESEGGASDFFSLLIVVITIWAGAEMATMSERCKLAGTIYGLVGIGAALYSAYEMLSGGGLKQPGVGALFVTIMVGLQLAMPIMALWLSNRELPDVTDYSEVFD